MFFNPVTRMRLGIHVDDIIARGSRKQTRLFWAALANKYSLKMWEEVDYDNPILGRSGRPSRGTADQLGENTPITQLSNWGYV